MYIYIYSVLYGFNLTDFYTFHRYSDFMEFYIFNQYYYCIKLSIIICIVSLIILCFIDSYGQIKIDAIKDIFATYSRAILVRGSKPCLEKNILPFSRYQSLLGEE